MPKSTPAPPDDRLAVRMLAAASVAAGLVRGKYDLSDEALAERAIAIVCAIEERLTGWDAAPLAPPPAPDHEGRGLEEAGGLVRMYRGLEEAGGLVRMYRGLEEAGGLVRMCDEITAIALREGLAAATTELRRRLADI